jgi:hypothetical protein
MMKWVALAVLVAVISVAPDAHAQQAPAFSGWRPASASTADGSPSIPTVDNLDGLNNQFLWFLGLGPIGVLDLQFEHVVQIPGLIQVSAQATVGWNGSDKATTTWPWSIGASAGYPLRWSYDSTGWITTGGGSSTSGGKTTLTSTGYTVPVPAHFELIPELQYRTVPKEMAFSSNTDVDGRYHMLGAGVRLQVRKSAESRLGTGRGYYSLMLRYYPVVSGGDLVDKAYGATLDFEAIGDMKMRLTFITTPAEESELQMFCLGFGYGKSDAGLW